jgi:hypothetical protein
MTTCTNIRSRGLQRYVLLLPLVLLIVLDRCQTLVGGSDRGGGGRQRRVKPSYKGALRDECTGC